MGSWGGGGLPPEKLVTGGHTQGTASQIKLGAAEEPALSWPAADRAELLLLSPSVPPSPFAGTKSSPLLQPSCGPGEPEASRNDR